MTHRPILLSLPTIAVLLLTRPLAAASLPPATSLLGDNPLAAFKPSPQTAVKTVPVDGQPFPTALHISLAEPVAKPWERQLRHPTTAAVRKGDILLATFYARTLTARTETGEGEVEFLLERAGQPHTKSIHFTSAVPRQWMRFDVPFTVVEDYAPGAANALLRVGAQPQTLEIGAIQLVSYGKDVSLKDLPRTRMTYPGRTADAPWRKAAAERIDRFRKADLTVLVADPAGKPVPGATVSIQMRRHAFALGSAVTARLLTDQSPDAEIYRQKVKDLFTRVVFENDLKWHPGFGRNVPQALEWLHAHRIQVRGHCLVWPSWRNTPRDLQKLKDNPEALRQRVAERITSAASAYRGKLVDWDVINETYDNHDLMDILGRSVMVDWFKLARAADPDVTLYINDYSILSNGGTDTAHQDHYEKDIRFLKDSGAPIGGIGLQSHFGAKLTDPAKLMQILDRYAALGLRLQSTEFDIDITDEECQADYTRDFMTTLFSHPAVDGIIMWGFWEASHWKPNAALFRRDWSIKPNGQAWIDLVTKQWWTNFTAQTNSAGTCATRGFLGDYEITVSHAGRTKTLKATLPASGQALRVALD